MIQITCDTYDRFKSKAASEPSIKFYEYIRITQNHKLKFIKEQKEWDGYLRQLGAYSKELISKGFQVEIKEYPDLLAERESREIFDFNSAKTALEEGVLGRGVLTAEFSGDYFKLKCHRDSGISGLFDEASGNLNGVMEWNETSETYDTKNVDLVMEALEKLEKNDPKLRIFKQGIDEAITAKREEIRKNQLPIAEVQALLKPGVQLFPYQWQALRFIRDTPGGVYLGLDMGLGKTLISLSYVFLTGKRALMVCPKVVRRNWVNEAQKFFGIEIFELDSTFKNYSEMKKYQVIVTNLEALKAHPNLKEMGFEILVLDEAHRCKNPHAMGTRNISILAQHIHKVILLSGTAIKNRKEELFSQIEIISPGLWESVKQVRKMRIGRILNDIAPIYFQRSKAQVLPDLPEKIQSIVEVPVEECLDLEPIDYSLLSEEEKSEKNQQILGELQRVRKSVALAKVAPALEVLKEMMMSGDSKAIVFSEFIEPLEELHQYFGPGAVLHHGQLRDEVREKAKADFQDEQKGIRFLLATRQSLGVGANITAADTAIFLNLPWSPADIKQGADRIHRIGQKRSVREIWLKAQNHNVDERIVTILARKLALCKLVLEGKPLTSEEREWMESPVSIQEAVGIKNKDDSLENQQEWDS